MAQFVLRCFFSLFLLVTLVSPLRGDQNVYTDALQNGWQDWGWAQINYANSSPVHSGSSSVAVTISDSSYQAIYIAHNAFNSTPYLAIRFWINGGPAGGQKLLIQGHAGGVAYAATNLPTLTAN